MKAEELRLGNFIQVRKGKIVPMIIHDLNLMLEWERVKYSRTPPIRPVPLTEEWLLKFGARKINHIYGYTFWTFHNTKQNNCLIDIYENRTEVNSRGVFHCEYVHQLQNLYFALTGEELTIETK